MVDVIRMPMLADWFFQLELWWAELLEKMELK